MTSRERLLTAINNQKADRLPCQVHSWMQYYLNTYLHGIDQYEAYEYFDMDAVIYVEPTFAYLKSSLLFTAEDRMNFLCTLLTGSLLPIISKLFSLTAFVRTNRIPSKLLCNTIFCLYGLETCCVFGGFTDICLCLRKTQYNPVTKQVYLLCRSLTQNTNKPTLAFLLRISAISLNLLLACTH